MSWGYSPRGPLSMNDRPRSQANISCASGSFSSAASSGSVVVSTWAHASKARRCCGLGTVSTSVDRSVSTTPRRLPRGVVSPPWTATSATRARARGWPRVKASAFACSADGIPRRSRKDRLSSLVRFANAIICTRPLHPGSVRHATEGGSRPARTTTASAASEGNSSSRSQLSNEVIRSAVSTSSNSRPTRPMDERGSSVGSIPHCVATSARYAEAIGGSSRASRRTTRRPRSRPRSAYRPSRVVLPMPPGPVTHRTTPSRVPSRRARRAATSCARPTNSRRRRAATRSAMSRARRPPLLAATIGRMPVPGQVRRAHWPSTAGPVCAGAGRSGPFRPGRR